MNPVVLQGIEISIMPLYCSSVENINLGYTNIGSPLAFLALVTRICGRPPCAMTRLHLISGNVRGNTFSPWTNGRPAKSGEAVVIQRRQNLYPTSELKLQGFTDNVARL